MSYAHRPFGLIFLFLMLIMGIQAGMKKPLCIDSNIVYKIDRVSAERNESVYGCSQFKKVSFSGFFYEKLDGLESRLNSLELALGAAISNNSVLIKIDETNPLQLQISGNTIHIGSEMLATDKLEKAVLQVVLKNKLNTADSIYLESLADYFSDTNKYQNLISEAFNKSIKKMNFSDKRKIRKNVIGQLKLNNAEGLIRAEMLSIEKLKLVLSGPNHADEFDKNLQQLGYVQSSQFANLKLDVIIDNKNLSVTEPDLADLARQNPQLKVGVQTSKGLFILPSYLKVQKNLEKKIFARYRIVFGLHDATEGNIGKYSENSESLIQIKGMLKSEASDFKVLFQSGVKAFLAKNKQLDFVQIHLPSYKLKSKALRHVSDYFKFVGNKNLAQAEYKAIGWSQTKWSTDLNAFKPVANYDVIQFFRIN